MRRKNTCKIELNWKKFESSDECNGLKDKFSAFVSSGNDASDNFKYWSNFLDKIFPVFNDLTQSFRRGDWDMHLDAVRRAIALFFAFGHSNYSLWCPLYYEECLDLAKALPLLQASFLIGDFVVHHSNRRANSVPIDQALESAYNKPAKGPNGVIGVSKKKESVAKWNFIKHEKAKYSAFLDEVTDFTCDDEYSLHHEFLDSFTKSEKERVKSILDYLMRRTVFSVPFSNIVSGEVIDEKRKEFYLTILDRGDKLYKADRKERIVDKTAQLFYTIPKEKVEKEKKDQKQVQPNKKKECMNLLRFVDIARARSYDLKYLFTYEMVATPFFLTREGCLRPADDKSDLLKYVRPTQI